MSNGWVGYDPSHGVRLLISDSLGVILSQEPDIDLDGHTGVRDLIILARVAPDIPLHYLDSFRDYLLSY